MKLGDTEISENDKRELRAFMHDNDIAVMCIFCCCEPSVMRIGAHEGMFCGICHEHKGIVEL